MSLDRDKIKKKRSSGAPRTSSRTSGTAKPRVKSGKTARPVSKTTARPVSKTTARPVSKTTAKKPVAGKPRTKTRTEKSVPRKTKPTTRAKKVERAPQVRQPKPPKQPKKIKFPKLGIKKSEKKTKGRVYRSVKERSFIPLLALILIIGGGVGFSYWYSMQAPIRLVGDLKNFDIPSDLDNFDPRNDPVLVPILREGERCLPELIKQYPTMKENEKIGTLALVRFFSSSDNMQILSLALLSENERLGSLAATATGYMGDLAVSALKEDLKKASEKQQKYVISALGKTKTVEALDTLLAETEKKNLNPDTKKYIIEALANYEEEKAAKGIIELGIDKNHSVIEKTIKTLEIHRQNQILNPYANSLVELVENRLIESESAVERARLIDIIGVIGKCTKPSGDNYINYFRGSVRKALKSSNSEEKAAAARTLGVFGDDEYIDRLFGLLRSKSQLVASSAADALINIGDSEIPVKIFENSLTDSKSKSLLLITSKLFEKYYLYILKDQKIQEAVEQIFKVLHRHRKDTKIKESYSELLFRYTETSPFKMSSNDNKMLMSMIMKTSIPPKRTKKILTREEELALTLTKREKLFAIIERYLKNSPEDQNLKIFFASFNKFSDEDAKVRMHNALLEYRKKTRGCHRQKPVEASLVSWKNWFQTFKEVEAKIALADKKINEARPLMEKKIKADLEKAEKLLLSAQRMYQDIEEKTQFKFSSKAEDISTLLYETKKARGIK
ncbi:HEAT repeat domain-containing protein [Candidatus Uabimicrobium sp. HlEnr_7]|uniref:HEAT repeat domain-containing protein n=1 Tax=Candidatus Uabimicrobium helgolandensis TaxID=3095367 RepID=UPI003558BA68